MTANEHISSKQSRFRLRIAAEELTMRRPADQPGRIARALRKASIDLNPHQVEAAVRGLRSLSERGLVLADEVGLGKTIEAGLVIAQLFAEGRNRVLVLAPSSLRMQWASELESKLGLESKVVDRSVEKKTKGSVFDVEGRIVICSYQFAARRVDGLSRMPWDCVIIDEAHRLRGAARGSKTARALRTALDGRPKLMLTATPMQNGLQELYGILSYLDPEVLGPFEEFRKAYPNNMEPDRAEGLKERVQPLVQRTLRRQVREYVRYTQRTSLVYRFTPTDDESRLYDEVSEYLSDDETLAIAPNRRPLMVLVYRKLLASSPQAISGTLARLAQGLRDRLEKGDFVDDEDQEELELIRTIEEDAFEEIHQASKKKKPPPPATPARLHDEINRLEELSALAASIRRPAKTEALLAAIDRAFTEAAGRRWPQKAVVFTESRRTQDALQQALLEAGHSVILLNGNSGGAEQRAAIVEDFRNNASILILTEAGAEGLNLQFANLVVNYDLPWNPQRIEQRIGRCHRYGQTKDVVVLNFLSDENAAESRLYELLEKKLQLFDGVFGATDEPLGALSDGKKFERRVFEIFQNARDEESIRSEFDNFQAELSDRIENGLARAQAALCDHFDDDVRAHLKMFGAQTEAALDKDEAALLSLVQGGISGAHLDEQGKLHLPFERGGHVLETSHRSRAKGDNFLSLDHPVTKDLIQDLQGDSATDVRYLVFDYTGGRHKISRLVPLLDGEGWWLAYKLSFDGPLAEDHVVHVVLAKTADGEITILDDAQIESLLSVTTRDIRPRSRMRAATLASTHGDAALAPKIAAMTANAKERSAEVLARRKAMVEATFDGRLDALAAQTMCARESVKRARARKDEDGARRLMRDLEKTLKREGEERMNAIRTRKLRLSELDDRAGLDVNRTLLATAYFWID